MRDLINIVSESFVRETIEKDENGQCAICQDRGYYVASAGMAHPTRSVGEEFAIQCPGLVSQDHAPPVDPLDPELLSAEPSQAR